MMPTTTSIVLMFGAGVLCSAVACAPPTPKVHQRPAAVPQTIEERPQVPVRELNPSFRPMVRKGSATTSTIHG